MMNRNMVDSVVQAWFESLVTLTRALPAGLHQQGSSGASLVFTGAPMEALNGVVSTAAEANLAEIKNLAGRAREVAEVPWGLQARGEPTRDLCVLAADLGLTASSQSPFMTRSLAGDSAIPLATETLHVRRVSGEEHELYAAVLAAGFEAPLEIFTAISPPSALDAPAMTAYLGEVDGEPVATAFAVRVRDYVGVFNISTLPQFRRGGYGRAITAAVLRDARDAGASTAFLLSSDMGFRVYESLGFRTTTQWTHFTTV
ncbi:GNAT family N-acetyltransferase [Streptomyces sp. NPDC026665]|uniref:GNAT family N-acetyltransferase n=1 Tax=Streptomyces sp. NPDC026665 TaxID=3154798 RepID=UPI0033FBD0A1